MNGMCTKNRKESLKGQSTVELALLTPLLTLLFFGMVQAVVFFQSSIMTQYGAFVAARAYQVYGPRKLQTINYPHLRDHPYTNADQTIAEAAAEKVIFEGLFWEHGRIDVNGDETSLDRFYKDGNDLSQNLINSEPSEGAVRVNMKSGQGVDVTYCAPIRFPGLQTLFAAAKKEYPCKNSRLGEGYEGVALMKSADLGIEPEVQP